MCFLVQAEYDAMLQEFAGEGIPLVASSVPADSFAPFLNDLLPLLMSKAVSFDLLTRTRGSTEVLLKQNTFIFSAQNDPSHVL